MMKRTVLLFMMVLFAIEAAAQTTIYWRRDTVYAGPGGGAIATITPPPSDTTAPTAPSGLGTSGVTATSVYLSWTGSTDSGGSGLAGYKIYRQKGSGASLPVGTVNSTTTAFSDQPLEANSSYTWTIIAFDAAQNHSSASGSANATTSATSTDTTAPSGPPNLRGLATTRQSTYKVRLDWDAATDAGGSGIAGYKVYRDDTLISGSNPVTNRYYEDSTGTANTSYTYKVKTIDGAGNLSGYSNAATVTTLRYLALSKDFNGPDGDPGGTDPWDSAWVQINSTLQPDISDGALYYWLPSLSSQTSFIASVKVLSRFTVSNPNSGIVFWATQGEGIDLVPPQYADYCEDPDTDELTPWKVSTGFYRAYVVGGYLYLDYFTDCQQPSTIATSSAIASGPGTLTLDVNSSTRRIKVYWSGTLKIDYTETNTSRPNSGYLALSGMSYNDNESIFDDLLVEQ